MNKVFLLGHLGADAELKVLANGQTVLNFRVATTEKWKDAKGELQEKTEWSRCALWGKRAESLSQYMLKGSKVLVEGALNTTTYEKDGEKRYSTEIKVFNVEFAGGGKGGEKSAAVPVADDNGGYSGGVGDDAIPF